MDEPLVEIRCDARNCGRILARIWDEPDNWTGTLNVPPCPKHHRGRTPLARARRIASRGEQPEVTVHLALPVEKLRPAISRARMTGRTVVEAIRGETPPAQ